MVNRDDKPIVAPTVSAEGGKPDSQANIAPSDPGGGPPPIEEVDIKWLEQILADAERAERNFRRRGREVVQIYRNDVGVTLNKAGRGTLNGKTSFNILYSNTEVMLPAIYQKPPQPVVRSRFTGGNMPVPPPPMPIGMPGMPMDPAMGGPAPPMGVAPPPMPPIQSGAAPIMMPPPNLPQPAPGRPAQKDIETASSVMEKALEIVLDDEGSHEAVKTAIKDVLLPGRGVCRVRWKPIIETQPVEDPVMGGQLNLPGTPGTPQTKDVKVWEEVGDEYVYWEDILVDPVRQANDTGWIAFRHLFEEGPLIAEFEGSPKFDALVAQGKIGTLLQWTEESAAKSPPSGGGYKKTNETLGDAIKKAMVWEVWDKRKKRIIWFIREAAGLVLRVDPDSLGLQGFFPVPAPMLAVTTSDSRIPKTFYDLYAALAEDLDETSKRISKLTTQIKVRGGYNSASNEIADILKADDGKMIAVDGVDMITGGLQNHIWLVPIEQWVAALQNLYLAREQQKMAIYEIMGISDIMRGSTKASETATAQRIKGSMGTVRLSDLRDAAANFARDLMRLKAEIIAKNFDAETLERMTGEQVTPEVEAILRSDFQRTCSIDVETDSTVAVDEQAEQQAMAMTMQAIQGVMQGIQGLLMTGILPPQQVILLGLEMLRMVLHPIRYSRGVVELLNDFTEQLMMQMQMGPVPPPPPGQGAANGAGAAPPPRGQGGPGAPPGSPAPPGGNPNPAANGGGPPPPMQ
jgi:hypothetical protein